jgi:membrane protease YdiL (CAAX protease family)
MADIPPMARWTLSLDRRINDQPMLARALPYLVYVLLLTGVAAAAGWQLWTYPVFYLVQCLIVAWLLWRYRGLTPELTIAFHWLAVPVGVLVAVLWLGLGKAMIHLWPDQFAATEPHNFEKMSPQVRWVSLSLRVLGMSILVPLFEELFVRSLLLRTFHNAKKTAAGVIQMACDLPGIGDTLMHTKLAAWAEQYDNVFVEQFHQTPLGRLSVFGVTASTILFALGHGMRDWPGAIVCGVLYCLLLAATRHKGLGPVVWAHGITNLLLFLYSVQTQDWQFL